jgi:hypothetical protein
VAASTITGGLVPRYLELGLAPGPRIDVFVDVLGRRFEDGSPEKLGRLITEQLLTDDLQG